MQLFAVRSLTLAAALLTSAALAQEQGPPPAPVKVGKAAKQSIAPTMSATGTVVSRNDARIAAEIAGRLVWVAEPGTHIERGGAIARVDDAALQLRLRDNHATIARLEANLKYQDSQVTRFQRLIEQKIASQSQVDEATAQRDMTAQEINQARVARDQTLHDLQSARVTAPFAGQVVERLRQPGEFVNAGGDIARLVDTRHIEVRANAPDAGRAVRGARARGQGRRPLQSRDPQRGARGDPGGRRALAPDGSARGTARRHLAHRFAGERGVADRASP